MSKPEEPMGRRQFLLAGGLAGAGAMAGADTVLAAGPNSADKTGHPLRNDHRPEKMCGV